MPGGQNETNCDSLCLVLDCGILLLAIRFVIRKTSPIANWRAARDLVDESAASHEAL